MLGRGVVLGRGRMRDGAMTDMLWAVFSPAGRWLLAGWIRQGRVITATGRLVLGRNGLWCEPALQVMDKLGLYGPMLSLPLTHRHWSWCILCIARLAYGLQSGCQIGSHTATISNAKLHAPQMLRKATASSAAICSQA